jgi:uncharacterized protein YecT (DUF1311 family)
MIIRTLTLAAATLALLTVAAADPLLTKQQIAQAAGDIEACIVKQGDAGKCVGIIQGPCDDAISAGGDAAHATCADNETAAWDALLNKAWAGLPPVLDHKTFAVLKGVQRQWLAYRDAKCAFYKVRDENVLGLAVAAQCRLDETARRTRELRDILAGL